MQKPCRAHGQHRNCGIYFAKELSFNLNETSSCLFVEAGEVFSRDNGDRQLDENEYSLNMTDPSNHVLRIGNAELPVSKNIFIKDGITHELEGIVIYAPATDKIYFLAEALPLINGTKINGKLNK
ncbi:hypothetical protein [Methanosarcina lacustris]|nr:hypothetical protein [Methanosarcina lacustris]